MNRDDKDNSECITFGYKSYGYGFSIYYFWKHENNGKSSCCALSLYGRYKNATFVSRSRWIVKKSHVINKNGRWLASSNNPSSPARAPYYYRQMALMWWLSGHVTYCVLCFKRWMAQNLSMKMFHGSQVEYNMTFKIPSNIRENGMARISICGLIEAARNNPIWSLWRHSASCFESTPGWTWH